MFFDELTFKKKLLVKTEMLIGIIFSTSKIKTQQKQIGELIKIYKPRKNDINDILCT